MKQNTKSPILWVPSVYFAIGMPFVVLNIVFVLMFKSLGISDSQIALWTSLIMLPWTLKFLWSPFLEIYKTKKFFIVLTEFISAVGFGLIALSLNMPSFFAVSIAIMAVIAVSGTSHDIVGDGIYIDELDKENQAKYIGWQGAFYNIAKIVASGGLVWLAGYLIDKFMIESVGDMIDSNHDAEINAWMIIMLIMAAVMLALGLYHSSILPSRNAHKADKMTAKETFDKLVEVIKDFFTKEHIFYYIAFIIIYRFAEGFVMKIVPLFLKADRASGGLGLSEKQIGLYYGTYGAAAFVIGSLLAGYYISHRGLSKTIFTLCCFFNLPFVAYTLLSLYQPNNDYFIGSAIVMEYFGYGFGFVGLMLFMMQQIAPGKHQMAHYAFATGIMNLGVMIPGSISGFMSDWLGYQSFFIFTLFAIIPALLITYFVPFTYPDK